MVVTRTSGLERIQHENMRLNSAIQWHAEDEKRTKKKEEGKARSKTRRRGSYSLAKCKLTFQKFGPDFR